MLSAWFDNEPSQALPSDEMGHDPSGGAACLTESFWEERMPVTYVIGIYLENCLQDVRCNNISWKFWHFGSNLPYVWCNNNYNVSEFEKLSL